MEQESVKKPFWPWLIPIVSIVYTVWVILLALDKTFGFAKAYEYFGFETWLYIGSALFIAFIVIMILFMPEGKKVRKETTEEKKSVTVEAMETETPAETVESAVVEPMETGTPIDTPAIESEIPIAEGAGVESMEMEMPAEAEPEISPEEYNIIPYPKEVVGAIYADTFISLDEKNVLNMRTFIGRSCLLCDKQDECWEKYKNTMGHDEFLSSIECLKVKKHGENAC